LIELRFGAISVFGTEQGSGSFWTAILDLLNRSFGQGRVGVISTGASRLLQFFSSLLKVLLNRTPDEFGDRSARPS